MVAWPSSWKSSSPSSPASPQQQVEAGADVIQIFDSWAGALSRHRLPPVLPRPHHRTRPPHPGPRRPRHLLRRRHRIAPPHHAQTGADVIGLDWRIPLDLGWKAIGYGCAVQGNLDPITLFAPEDVLKSRVREILTAADGRPGHIFNLGHGIVPGTPVDNVINVVKWVKEFGAQ